MKNIVLALWAIYLVVGTATAEIQHKVDEFTGGEVWWCHTGFARERGYSLDGVFIAIDNTFDKEQDIYVSFNFYLDDWGYYDTIYVKYLNQSKVAGKPVIAEVVGIKPATTERDTVTIYYDVKCNENIKYHMSPTQFQQTFLDDDVEFRAAGQGLNIDFKFKDKQMKEIKKFWSDIVKPRVVAVPPEIPNIELSEEEEERAAAGENTEGF